MNAAVAALIAVGFGGVGVKLLDRWFRAGDVRTARTDRLAESVGDEASEMRRELRAEGAGLREELVKARAALADCEQRSLALAGENARLKFSHGLSITQTDETENPPKGAP